MIFTSLSPNAEADDVRLAAKLLFQPWLWKRGQSSTTLEQEFKKIFSFPVTTSIYSFQSGRNALYALLKALELVSDDEVLIQAYTCVAVPEPVLWVGAKPVYVDITEDLTMDPVDLEKKITPKSKVLIIQHTFGNPANIDKLVGIARVNNLFIIEDCAHAMGAMYDKIFVGSFGHASFFSFGRDKVLSSVFGGLLVVKDRELSSKVEKIRAHFIFPSYFSIFRQLLHPVVMSLAKGMYSTFSIGKIMIEVFKFFRLIPKAVEPQERRGEKPSFINQRMPNALAIVALHQLNKLERYNSHRRALAMLYTKELSMFKFQTFSMRVEPIWLRFTLFIESVSAQQLIVDARKHGLEFGDWYQQPISPNNVNYEKINYTIGTCPKAEELARCSVNLPTHSQITKADAYVIVEFTKKYAVKRNN